MLTVIALFGVGAPVGFTAYRILARMRRFAVDRARTRMLCGFVDAFARELDVGAVPVEAAGHAVDAMAGTPEARAPGGRDLAGELGAEIRRVRLGAVPGNGRGGRSSEHGGAGGGDADLRRLFTVWGSSMRHGTALGRLMDRMRVDLDARLTHLGHTSSALAGARLTETILLLLPVGALGLGQSMGLTPVSFLTGNILGVLLLVFGVLLACTGALWTESLTVTVLGGVGRRAGPTRPDAAHLLDLFAESLAAGLPLAVAWSVAASCRDAAAGPGTGSDPDPAADPAADLAADLAADPVGRVAALLALGAGAAAWEPLRDDPWFGPVARMAESGSRNGARLAEGVRARAERLRAEAADASLVGAERVLVVVAAPLTLCFLPAFVLVGLIPLVVGFAAI
ncbi:type II secretion system F family protein [Corynebacterium terpenotabidum]|uniref:Type II secretion system protein GspF domain-containing protein n=1 Tax=Corynebacterium terpenotabidum Y-11 TaxID=1200352 RepID=S4XF12_9CORY|nr:hypothetical protein [Corynebacterium terpenotabidum]AGP31727.1 hypothetical protein A606_10440 [Corynebacterium terpenotabidum Y-11]